jgi:hypothetical protein
MAKKRLISKLKHPSEVPLPWRFQRGALRIIVQARTWFEARERAMLVFTQNNEGIEPSDVVLLENPYD